MIEWNVLFITFAVFGCGPIAREETASARDRTREVLDLVKQLDSDAKRRHFWNDYTVGNEFEIVLQKLIKLGGAAEGPLEFKLKEEAALRMEGEKRLAKYSFDDRFSKDSGYRKESMEVDRLSNNCELLTALRRVQKKPDPLSVQVIPPNEIKAIPGKLPSFSVKLKSVDAEEIPVWTQRIPRFHGSRREAQWRFEVKTSTEQILPVRPRPKESYSRGGIKSDGWLKFGDHLDTVLPMGDFIDIAEPGDYTVTVIYHPKLPIADITNVSALDDLITFRSESFKLIVDKGPKLVIESSDAIRAEVRSLINELPDEGVVKIVGGVYDEDDFKFLSPQSPAGKIITLNWRAVPSLLDALSDVQLSRHRKAWILSILYTITAEHEMNPVHSGALPDHEGMAGKNTLGADLSGNSRIVPSRQDSLISKWQVYGDRYLNVRESAGN